MENLTVVIQAGGESKRMGRSKATVPFLGEPLIMRGVSRLSPIAGEMIITTNEPEKLDFLQEKIDAGQLRLQRDLLETRGALNGIYTALTAATKEYVSLVACDMVFASAPLIESQVALLEETGADLIVPVTKSGFEPFHATYRRETCLKMVTEAVEAGEIKASCWFDKAQLIKQSLADVLKADPRGGCFMNVNTPQELADVEARILARGMSSKEPFEIGE